jgi:hypothetical protein
MVRNNKNKNKRPLKTVTKAPVAVSTAFRNPFPQIKAAKNSLRIKHCEPLVTLVGTTNFVSTVVSQINPGSLQWCMAFASRFETYKCHSLKFKYVTRCSTSNEGRIAIRFDSDVLDAVPDDIETFLAGGLVSESSYWANVDLTIPKSAFDVYGKRYTRISSVPANADAKTYDIGSFSVSTYGSNAVPVGRVYIEYEFEFFTPQIQQIASGAISSDSPVADPANPTEYSFPPSSVLLDQGKLPAVYAMPNEEEVAAGADVNKPLLRFFTPWEGIVTMIGKQAAAVSAVASQNSNGVNYSSLTTTMNDGVDEVNKDWKVNVTNGLNRFFQPFFVDGVAAVTAMALNIASGRYKDFKTV